MPGQKRNIGYFANWDIYARGYLPQNIPARSLTHILYSFANVKPDSGEVYLSDAWADEQIHWDGDSWDEGGNNLFGCFKQLYLLKKQNRHLKVLLSIGGWSYSGNFAPMASNPQSMQTFADSSAKIVEDYGIDGIDIDWEFPSDDRQAQQYVELLRLTRESLDRLAASKGEPAGSYELTVAAPCGPSNYETLRVREMDAYLSFWNLMAYDYAGSWDATTGHQANVFAPPNQLSTSRAINFFHNQNGVAKHKLVVGIPLYGRSFKATHDGPGHPYNGVGKGSWEEGTYDYKALPLPGAVEHVDQNAIASWCYEPSNGEFITYDNLPTALAKAQYINGEGLGGAMYWELSGDYPPNDPRAIVPAVAHTLAQSGGLDGKANHLHFPQSKWDNLRNGM